MTPVVSVVMPTHNRSKLLRRSVLSVLTQTFRDLELIVVDDCSTDDTQAVLAEFTDARLRVIRREKNGRAAAARNDGIAAARGEFIAFQDDDDVWMPHKLQRQVEAMRKAPPDVGLCLCGYLRWHPTHVLYIGTPHHFELLDFKKGMTLFINYGLIATPAWLVRKAVLDEVGAFDTRMRTWDDLELAMRIERRWKFIHVDEPLFVQDQVIGSGLMNQFFNFSHDMQAILEKQGDRWPQLRQLHFHNVGRLELHYGNPVVGRRWLAKSLRVAPTSLRGVARWGRTAAFWCASFLQQDFVRRASAVFRRIGRRPAWWLVDDPRFLTAGSGRRT